MRYLLSITAVVLLTPLFALADDTADSQARKKSAEKRFEKLKDYLKDRRVTHIVELLAEWGEFADANQQDALTEMAAALFKDAKAESVEAGGAVVAPKIKYRGTSATTKVKNLLEDASAYFVDELVAAEPPGGGGDQFRSLGQHVIVAARTLTARPNHEAANCLILTNAATAEVQGLDKCILLASGNVVATDKFSLSVVVCRGNVEYEFGRRDGSLVKAGGVFTYPPHLTDAARKSGNPIPTPAEGLTTANDTKFLGVKFYSVAEDGLEAAAEKGVVTVAKVDETKGFGKAGVKKGDVIVSINGEKVPTLHELDRLACRATVASGTAKVTVEREKETQEIEVKLFDWSAYTPKEKADTDPKAKPPEKK